MCWPGRQTSPEPPLCPISCRSYKAIYAPTTQSCLLYSTEVISLWSQHLLSLVSASLHKWFPLILSPIILHYFCLVPSSSFSMSPSLHPLNWPCPPSTHVQSNTIHLIGTSVGMYTSRRRTRNTVSWLLTVPPHWGD